MRHFIYTFILTAAIVIFPASLNAAGLINQANNVFKFQQKLAEKGNTHAQYKLAFMYETGEGTKVSFDKALYWYGLASKAGLKKAEDRTTYLMVKELGYDKKLHAGWIDGVVKEAGNRQPEAMLLLGQLYRQGLGVKKNLKKSLALLNQVSVLGDADVDEEIESIYDEIDAKKASRIAYKKKKAKAAAKVSVAKAKAAKVKPVITKVAKAKPVKQKVAKKKKQKAAPVAVAKVVKKVTEKEKILAAKKRRYEAAMAKLKLEQQMIDEQQASITGEAVASVDDEF